MEHEEYNKGSMVIWVKDGKITNAWLKNGNYAIPISEDESILTPDTFYRIVEEEQENNIFRCSRCGTKMSKEGHHHLFAAYVCDPCHEIYIQEAKDEIARGAVCSICRKPYSQCYC